MADKQHYLLTYLMRCEEEVHNILIKFAEDIWYYENCVSDRKNSRTNSMLEDKPNVEVYSWEKITMSLNLRKNDLFYKNMSNKLMKH